MRIPGFQWWSGRFLDRAIEQEYLTYAWPSNRTQIGLTLIGFSVAWIASSVTDFPYLAEIDWFKLVLGLRLSAGAFGVAAGIYILTARPPQASLTPWILLWAWMSLSTATTIFVSTSHAAVQTEIVDMIDILDFNSFWMSLQILGIGITLSSTYIGVLIVSLLYGTAYIATVSYWRDFIDVSLVGPSILVVAACVFAVILTATFSASARRRYFTTWKYEEARKEAEKAQEFSAFLLTTAGHDIRQPIYSLDLSATAMEQLADAGEWERVRAMISRQRLVLRSVSGLLSSILELSNRDGNGKETRNFDTSLDEAFASIVASFHSLAAHHGIELRVAPTRLVVGADPALVTHILNNLVANALTHSRGDRVLIGARPRKDTIAICVIDNGQGYGAATESGIDKSEAGPASGFGLGTSIMDRLAELGGMQLRRASTPGKGVVAELICPRI